MTNKHFNCIHATVIFDRYFLSVHLTMQNCCIKIVRLLRDLCSAATQNAEFAHNEPLLCKVFIAAVYRMTIKNGQYGTRAYNLRYCICI